MNLLTDQWIPVRPLDGGGMEKITLRRLLCEEGRWELCLPRDDMELAALQLLICITQTIMTPKDESELRSRIVRPVLTEEFDEAVQPFGEWFQLDHPKYPFMQVRGVNAKEQTFMDKLMAGLTGATNSCFVNQPDMADGLCGGCATIALFNQASCAPSFGGGFKGSLRGGSPITTLVQGDHLRRTVWLNILSNREILNILPWHPETSNQKPTWVDPIRAGKTIPAQQIGFIRGLLWQPAHIELLPPAAAESCPCCGCLTKEVFTSFHKSKFSYTIEGNFPHPHSPRIMTIKKGVLKERFASFTSSAPAWTQLARFVVKQQLDVNSKVGQQPAAVVLQARSILGKNSSKLNLVVGGYRNNQASVLERRHEVFTLNHGWDKNTDVIKELVSKGLGYWNALSRALSVFVNGSKADKVKGAGIKIHQTAEVQYYRRSEPIIEDTLARIDFANPVPRLADMCHSLREIVESLFEDSIRPYLNDPELVRTRAVARRKLIRNLSDLEPQTDKGGANGTTETP
ncbi:MAG TPA: type I-E CRISPR-associated protein Cse1/CasA [Methanoregulaceae archaeon]|nr:type I-E CRISPR-associated protein Cse1/CasA [Methanoregulaceae archaeon]